jgi:hypothetical protein
MKQIGTAELVYVQLDKCPECGTPAGDKNQCQKCGFSLVAIEYSYAVHRILALFAYAPIIKDKTVFEQNYKTFVATVMMADSGEMDQDVDTVVNEAERAAGLYAIERIIHEGKIYLPTGTK